jgi:bacterioferritin (cytochrome b1)
MAPAAGQSPPGVIPAVIFRYNALPRNPEEGAMERIKAVQTREDAARLLAAALRHEWAVSFEYVTHAYSMPKGRFFYDDPVLRQRTDARAQTIQIGIDEMYHALQLGVILTQMGVEPSFATDEIVRYPRIVDNLKEDKRTEDEVTALYQSAEVAPGAFPKIENMIGNIAYDEVRHSAQFAAMIGALEASADAGAEGLKPHPDRDRREDLTLLHGLCRRENEATHRYLRYVLMFSEHQDLGQRLFKNSINHMRHWDKLAGTLVKLGDVIAIENAETDAAGVERSVRPMPIEYPGTGRLSALATLPGLEREIAGLYEAVLKLPLPEDVQAQLRLHLALTREHIYTQDKLLENARRIRGLD